MPSRRKWQKKYDEVDILPPPKQHRCVSMCCFSVPAEARYLYIYSHTDLTLGAMLQSSAITNSSYQARQTVIAVHFLPNPSSFRLHSFTLELHTTAQPCVVRHEAVMRLCWAQCGRRRR